jgi:hypothetical protein
MLSAIILYAVIITASVASILMMSLRLFWILRGQHETGELTVLHEIELSLRTKRQPAVDIILIVQGKDTTDGRPVRVLVGIVYDLFPLNAHLVPKGYLSVNAPAEGEAIVVVIRIQKGPLPKTVILSTSCLTQMECDTADSDRMPNLVL